jgi:hypothetical protein
MINHIGLDFVKESDDGLKVNVCQLSFDYMIIKCQKCISRIEFDGK